MESGDKGLSQILLYRFGWIPPFLKSPQKIPNPLGSGLPYLPDKAARNLLVSSFWRDQVEGKANVSDLLGCNLPNRCEL